MTTIRRNPTAIQEVQTKRLQLARTTATADVNKSVGTIRQRYITSIPGQDAVYAAKEAEATRFLSLAAAPETLEDFPFIEAEIGVLAPTANEVAQTWLNMGYYWRLVAAQLERCRMTAINGFTTCNTEAEIQSVLQTFHTQVDNL